MWLCPPAMAHQLQEAILEGKKNWVNQTGSGADWSQNGKTLQVLKKICLCYKKMDGIFQEKSNVIILEKFESSTPKALYSNNNNKHNDDDDQSEDQLWNPERPNQSNCAPP